MRQPYRRNRAPCFNAGGLTLIMLLFMFGFSSASLAVLQWFRQTRTQIVQQLRLDRCTGAAAQHLAASLNQLEKVCSGEVFDSWQDYQRQWMNKNGCGNESDRVEPLPDLPFRRDCVNRIRVVHALVIAIRNRAQESRVMIYETHGGWLARWVPQGPGIN